MLSQVTCYMVASCIIVHSCQTFPPYIVCICSYFLSHSPHPTHKDHIGEVFVLESHPSDPRVLLSAGHDGLVIFWDMLAGVKLKSFQLEWEDGPVCVFDCKFSPDGLRCAAVDSYGFLTIMGFGSNELYKKVHLLYVIPRVHK